MKLYFYFYLLWCFQLSKFLHTSTPRINKLNQIQDEPVSLTGWNLNNTPCEKVLWHMYCVTGLWQQPVKHKSKRNLDDCTEMWQWFQFFWSRGTKFLSRKIFKQDWQAWQEMLYFNLAKQSLLEYATYSDMRQWYTSSVTAQWKRQLHIFAYFILSAKEKSFKKNKVSEYSEYWMSVMN